MSHQTILLCEFAWDVSRKLLGNTPFPPNVVKLWQFQYQSVAAILQQWISSSRMQGRQAGTSPRGRSHEGQGGLVGAHRVYGYGANVLSGKVWFLCEWTSESRIRLQMVQEFWTLPSCSGIFYGQSSLISIILTTAIDWSDNWRHIICRLVLISGDLADWKGYEAGWNWTSRHAKIRCPDLRLMSISNMTVHQGLAIRDMAATPDDVMEALRSVRDRSWDPAADVHCWW